MKRTSCERQCELQGFEPTPHALGQRDANDGQEFLGSVGRRREIGEFPNRRRPAVAQPVPKRVERVVPRRLRVERKAHHRLVVAHQRDFVVRVDALACADREIDRSEAVGAAIDEVADKDNRAPLPPLRLARRLIDERLQKIRPAVDVADGEDLHVRRDRARQDIGFTTDDRGHGRSRFARRRKHCTPAWGRARIVSMFLTFFANLRQAHVPVTPREYLDLMRALEGDLAERSVEEFYRLSRAVLVKDERNLDRFDVVFASTFKGVLSVAAAVEAQELPEEWLRRLAERYLSPEERAEIEKLGFDRLMETLRQRLAEQKERHQGGSKWIGTGRNVAFRRLRRSSRGGANRPGPGPPRQRRQGLGQARVQGFRRRRRTRSAQHQARAAPAAPIRPRGRGRGARPGRNNSLDRRTRAIST